MHNVSYVYLEVAQESPVAAAVDGIDVLDPDHLVAVIMIGLIIHLVDGLYVQGTKDITFAVCILFHFFYFLKDIFEKFVNFFTCLSCRPSRRKRRVPDVLHGFFFDLQTSVSFGSLQKIVSGIVNIFYRTFSILCFFRAGTEMKVGNSWAERSGSAGWKNAAERF